MLTMSLTTFFQEQRQMQRKNVVHRQEERFAEATSMTSEAAAASPVGFANVTTGQVVTKKAEFMQRAASLGRGAEGGRDSLNPEFAGSPAASPASRMLMGPHVQFQQQRHMAASSSYSMTSSGMGQPGAFPPPQQPPMPNLPPMPTMPQMGAMPPMPTMPPMGAMQPMPTMQPMPPIPTMGAAATSTTSSSMQQASSSSMKMTTTALPEIQEPPPPPPPPPREE